MHRPAPFARSSPPAWLWSYVAFATKTRGWLPIEAIEKVVPDKAPEPPKFRKPKADGKTA